MEEREKQKEARRAFRAVRNRAFKYYVRERGLERAKLLAVCMRKKQEGTWVETDAPRMGFGFREDDENDD